MEKVDFLLEKCWFLELIWDEIVIICTCRSYKGESHKTSIIIVPEGFSKPSEDRKIETKSFKNGPKFEV